MLPISMFYFFSIRTIDIGATVIKGVIAKHPKWFSVIVSHLRNCFHLTRDKIGLGKLLLYHILEIIYYIHDDLHIYHSLDTHDVTGAG